jgi:hypothetical protein
LLCRRRLDATHGDVKVSFVNLDAHEPPPCLQARYAGRTTAHERVKN